MQQLRTTERIDTLVIGGGQAGLSTGYHLKRRGLSFVIVDAGNRVGDVWRNRWDSLRLFTPAKLDGLDGMPFPAPPNSFPTHNEMADYLEAYATRFDLPVECGVRVDRLYRDGDRFVAEAGTRRFEACNVVVAMAPYQKPKVPSFAGDLDPAIVQIHSRDYRNPGQLQPGGVLIVGAGNSGAEIGLEVSRGHTTWISGRPTGHIPFDIHGLPARLFLFRLVLRGLFHRVLTVDTPIGRRARPVVLSRGGPLIRTRPGVLKAAGIQRVPRTVGARDGLPLLEDGRTLDVANIIWCSGFHAGFSWIDMPVLGDVEPRHDRGIVRDMPGLYFVGLEFLYSFSSIMIHGVGRDADRVAAHIAARTREDAGDANVAPVHSVVGSAVGGAA
ncbi:MAG TPA: NAD(P)/FAD-dependent oxidoreductase [Longimicrobiales bacterium]|nr:NAD(P)/FAD-dependent oxidoreductase [Longimicrobiales bacterium]